MRLDPDDPNWPELLSHPGNEGQNQMPLERHLVQVAARARDVTPSDAETAGGGSMAVAAETVGLSHDFGKATDWFQVHIRDEGSPDGPSHHARLGGLFTYYALRQRGYDARTRLAGLVAVAKHHGNVPKTSRFVKDGLDQDATWGDGGGGYNGDAARQAARIESIHPEFARAVTHRATGGDGSWDEFLRLLTTASCIAGEDVETEAETIRDWLHEDFFRVGHTPKVNTRLLEDGTTYLDELRLYGTLTFADKTHAAHIRPGDERLHARPLDHSQILDYIRGLDDAKSGTLKERLNGLRGAIQDHVAGEGDADDPVRAFLNSEADVATLTLPTGYGKTLTGLLAAARIRETVGGDRILYALPFTSVIDQTADVLRDVLADTASTGGHSDGGVDPATGRALTVHHHLSETVTLADGNRDGIDAGEGPDETTDEESDRATLLAESWRAGVTLTTFVQLFESLAGPRNTQSMKLPGLYGDVVIIDEPQALPLTWWPLVERLIDALVTEYGATVVLMTATQPRIVDQESTFALIEDSMLDGIERTAFSSPPERVQYRFHQTALSTGQDDSDALGYDTAAGELRTAVLGTTEATLAICNTIDSAANLFDAVRSVLPTDGTVDIAGKFETEFLSGERVATPKSSEGGNVHRQFAESIAEQAAADRPAILHLSTRLRPCDRRFLLSVVSELTSMDIPLLVVSTQLVEAGVDVSFDRVFRDFAPIDSIVQAAGRCNRSFERAPEPGMVVIWRLAPPEGRDSVPGETVYARRESDTDLDLLAKSRQVLADVPTDEWLSESRIADTAVTDYHAAVGKSVATVREDNELRAQFQQANGSALRHASIIDSPFSFEVYVCRTDAELALVRELRESETAFEFDRVRAIRDDLAEVRVSVPVYRPGSEAAEILLELPPLSTDADRQDATERVIEPGNLDVYFDARKGVLIPESNVEGRFL